MKMKYLIYSLLPLAVLPVANAGISIFGHTTGYQSTNKDWLSETANDIDGNGLGTDGYIFFGNFDGAGGNQTWGNGGDLFAMPATLITDVQASYVTAATMGDNAGDKIGSFAGYEALDNPLAAIVGTDGVSGNITATGAGEVVNFTISGLTENQVVRVGLVTVLNDDTRARWDQPTIGLTDGTNTATISGLPNLSSSTDTTGPGWVFFDIDTDGDYSVMIPPDAAGVDPDVTGLGGLTFDSVVVPESSAYALLAGMLALGSVMTRRRRA